MTATPVSNFNSLSNAVFGFALAVIGESSVKSNTGQLKQWA